MIAFQNLELYDSWERKGSCLLFLWGWGDILWGEVEVSWDIEEISWEFTCSFLSLLKVLINISSDSWNFSC